MLTIGTAILYSFDPNPTTRHTWWTLTIGGMFTYLSLYAVNQTQVQRLKTCKNLKSAQKALWLNWPILSLLSLSTSFSGLAIYYYYRSCDPLRQGRIKVRDQTMPLFVVDAMGDIPGLPGLFVSGIFSASLSTVSAALNSLAAVTLEDYLKPLYQKVKRKPMPDLQSSFPTKVMAFLYGVVCIAVAFLAQKMGGVLQASLTIFGVVGGPLFALFTMGMFTTRANQRVSSRSIPSVIYYYFFICCFYCLFLLVSGRDNGPAGGSVVFAVDRVRAAPTTAKNARLFRGRLFRVWGLQSNQPAAGDGTAGRRTAGRLRLLLSVPIVLSVV